MFKRTPCYDCQRPERLPNGLCEKGCQVKADYLAERAEYYKKRKVELGLQDYSYNVSDKIRRRTTRRYGGQG